MRRRVLSLVFSVSLFFASVYLLLHSNLVILLEGENPDGSSSLTWRSGVAAAILLSFSLWFSFWAFRRYVVLAIFTTVVGSVLSWYILSESKVGFIWEPHSHDGTYPLTWRSDLMLLANVAFWVAISFAIRPLIGRGSGQETKGTIGSTLDL